MFPEKRGKKWTKVIVGKGAGQTVSALVLKTVGEQESPAPSPRKPAQLSGHKARINKIGLARGVYPSGAKEVQCRHGL